VRGKLGGIERDRDARACASAQIASIGGSQPVTLDAPVMVSSFGLGLPSSASTTASSANVPSRSHSMKRRRATLAHGSRLAWCSTTVVATTSPGSKASR